MSFREKSAWITLISILLVSILYFLHMPVPFGLPPEPWMFHALLVCVALFIAIEVIAYIVLYLRFPKDARTPKDERERLIDLKATAIAAYVYVIGSFAAVSMGHHGANGSAIGYGVLMAFVFAVIIKNSMRIYYYRRGC
ncbi:MAG: hypothetical protein HW386_1516 [Gammaproteobacteria bacterium]|nr:hypothetical protein [Gammaproteobacteria bacterium]